MTTLKIHKDITYNPIQKETIKWVDEDVNLVICTPTSSGKTIVAEQFIYPVLEKNKKAIYLSPLKALADEKSTAWIDWPYSQLILTSDMGTSKIPTKEQLILMTTETLDSKTRGAKNWLRQVGIVVIDEAHLLGSVGRGSAMEVGITRFAMINKNAQIVCLSATISNGKEFVKWLERLNGKKTIFIDINWRPVEQEHKFYNINARYETEFDKRSLPTIKNILKTSPGRQTIIFVHSFAKGNKISSFFNIPFHNSRLSKNQRQYIETAFREHKIDSIVSTSTLAYGMNLPADIGIIVGGHRGYNFVDLADIKQMAGRIGRYGLSKKGIVHYLFRNDYYEEYKEGLDNIPPITSHLSSHLYFHIVSFIARENMTTITHIKQFLAKTFEPKKLKIENSIKYLIDKDIIHDNGGQLIALPIGKASAMMYIDPLDLDALQNNLREKPLESIDLAIAFASIPSNASHTNIAKNTKLIVNLPFTYQSLFATNLYNWLTDKPIEGYARTMLFTWIKDIGRWMSGLRILGIDKTYCSNVEKMIKYGASSNILDLLDLPGVGKVKANKLFAQGIKNLKDIKKEKIKSRNILGSSLFEQLMNKDDDPQKVVLIF
jgi:helicase